MVEPRGAQGLRPHGTPPPSLGSQSTKHRTRLGKPNDQKRNKQRKGVHCPASTNTSTLCNTSTPVPESLGTGTPQNISTSTPCCFDKKFSPKQLISRDILDILYTVLGAMKATQTPNFRLSFISTHSLSTSFLHLFYCTLPSL